MFVLELWLATMNPLNVFTRVPAIDKRSHMIASIPSPSLGHDSDPVINDQGLADDPRGRIGAKKLGAICHLLGRD